MTRQSSVNMAFESFSYAKLEDEHAKVLLHEVNTRNVGRYDRVGVGAGGEK